MKNIVEQAIFFTSIDTAEENLSQVACKLEIYESGGIREIIDCGTCDVIRCEHYGKFCVMDNEGNIIVPIGKYSFIDGFDHGYARIKVEQKNHEEFWGIIDEFGNEVVEPIYDNIWKFFRKNRETTILEKDDEQFWFDLIDGDVCDFDPWEYHHNQYMSQGCEQENPENYFSIDNCYDCEGNFDYDRLEDAILDGEYVPEDR